MASLVQQESQSLPRTSGWGCSIAAARSSLSFLLTESRQRQRLLAGQRTEKDPDLKTKFIEEGTTQTEIDETIGVSLLYVNRITKGREQIVNKTFIKILEELGYDVELVYKKREGSKKNDT